MPLGIDKKLSVNVALNIIQLKESLAKLEKEKNFYIIEINTVPGMTSHSNVPKSGSFLGLTYNEVVQKIIDASL